MTIKGKSYRRSNPRDVLKRLIAEHPKAGKRKLLALFVDQVRGPDAKHALDSVACPHPVIYWTTWRLLFCLDCGHVIDMSPPKDCEERR